MAGVNPELVPQHHRAADDEYSRRQADDRQRPIEEPVGEETGAGLAHRGRVVELFAGVMHNVGSPDQIGFVAHAVMPVVAEVVADQADGPDPPVRRRQFEDGEVFVRQQVDTDVEAFGEDVQHLATQAQGDARQAVAQGKCLTASPEAPDQLQQQQREECGDRIDDGIGHFLPPCFVARKLT